MRCTGKRYFLMCRPADKSPKQTLALYATEFDRNNNDSPLPDNARLSYRRFRPIGYHGGQDNMLRNNITVRWTVL